MICRNIVPLETNQAAGSDVRAERDLARMCHAMHFNVGLTPMDEVGQHQAQSDSVGSSGFTVDTKLDRARAIGAALVTTTSSHFHSGLR